MEWVEWDEAQREGRVGTAHYWSVGHVLAEKDKGVEATVDAGMDE